MKTIRYQTEEQMDETVLGHHPEQCLFFDIETTGLSPRASSLYLIGAMVYQPETDRFEIIQWFADHYREEHLLIGEFLALLEQYDYLYHFNGKTFDIPYILHKCQKYHIELSGHCAAILQDSTGEHSIDLLARIRPLKKKLGLTHANQTSLEHWLGRTREDTYNGGELISVYSQYMQDLLLHPERAEESERLLLLHNHDDMEGMLAVSRMLLYQRLLHPAQMPAEQLRVTDVAFSSPKEGETSCLFLSFKHGVALPRVVTLSAAYPGSQRGEQASLLAPCTLELEPDRGRLRIPVVLTELKYFLPHPKEYYYLPAEDQAVHRSVASFVEPSHRQKATPATCYIRKHGYFLPSLSAQTAKKTNAPEDRLNAYPVFSPAYREKPRFYELPKDPEPALPFWREYLIQELGCF